MLVYYKLVLFSPLFGGWGLCGRVLNRELTIPGLRVQTSTDRKLSCPSTFSHTSPPSCDGDLEFSRVQIYWPWLANQLRVQVGLRVPTPIS